jgi:hypothetical protein
MISNKPIKRKDKKPQEVTPIVIESAAKEIIGNAKDILDMYEIDGSVVTLGLGILPKQKGGGKQQYNASFEDSEEYNISVKYRCTPIKSKTNKRK